MGEVLPGRALQRPRAHDLLWRAISRFAAHAQHEKACKAAGIEDYTLRDARHSVAVRARKAGRSLEWIAEQLGHKGILQAATVYARFTQTVEERRSELTIPPNRFALRPHPNWAMPTG